MTVPIVRVTPVTTADQIRVTELLEKVFGKFVDSDQERATFNAKIAASAIRGRGRYEFTATCGPVMEHRACNGNRETFRPHHAQWPLRLRTGLSTNRPATKFRHSGRRRAVPAAA
ncbi:MAG: hypothetical protein ACE5GT_04720 [Rhodospirillales bacterium]